MIKNIEIIKYNNGFLEKTFDNVAEESKINIIGEKNPIITDELNEKRDEIYLKYVEWKYGKDN